MHKFMWMLKLHELWPNLRKNGIRRAASIHWRIRHVRKVISRENELWKTLVHQTLILYYLIDSLCFGINNALLSNGQLNNGMGKPRTCWTNIKMAIILRTLPAYLKLNPVRCSINAPPRYIYLAIRKKFPIKMISSLSKPTNLSNFYFPSELRRMHIIQRKLWIVPTNC